MGTPVCRMPRVWGNALALSQWKVQAEFLPLNLWEPGHLAHPEPKFKKEEGTLPLYSCHFKWCQVVPVTTSCSVFITVNDFICFIPMTYIFFKTLYYHNSVFIKPMILCWFYHPLRLTYLSTKDWITIWKDRPFHFCFCLPHKVCISGVSVFGHMEKWVILSYRWSNLCYKPWLGLRVPLNNVLNFWNSTPSYISSWDGVWVFSGVKCLPGFREGFLALCVLVMLSGSQMSSDTMYYHYYSVIAWFIASFWCVLVLKNM